MQACLKNGGALASDRMILILKRRSSPAVCNISEIFESLLGRTFPSLERIVAGDVWECKANLRRGVLRLRPQPTVGTPTSSSENAAKVADHAVRVFMGFRHNGTSGSEAPSALSREDL